MCVSHVFGSHQNPCFLRQILVIINQSLRDPLQIDLLLRQRPLLGRYL